jgi:hypothetical protein
MTKSKNMAAAALAAGALGLGAGMVRAAEPTTEELMKQIDALQAKVQQLETRQQALNSKDVDATVAAVLRDADKRSELLQMEGFTAGWTKDKGFRLQSADGNWVLHPGEFVVFDLSQRNGAGQKCAWINPPEWTVEDEGGILNVRGSSNPFLLRLDVERKGYFELSARIDDIDTNVLTVVSVSQGN